MQDDAARAELVKELHLLKTGIFMEMVESGAMPLRPGVKRLVGGWRSSGADYCVWLWSSTLAARRAWKVPGAGWVWSCGARYSRCRMVLGSRAGMLTKPRHLSSSRLLRKGHEGQPGAACTPALASRLPT
jgi:hypothetical protein